MEKVEVPIHKHPLLPFTRFDFSWCKACYLSESYIYGGYRCNELECGSVFHKDCAEYCPEINHSSHPDHPLKLRLSFGSSSCSRCGSMFLNGYFCKICDFKLDLRCANGRAPLLTLENSSVHEHPLEVFDPTKHISFKKQGMCKTCDLPVDKTKLHYKCYQCELVFHEECAKFFPEANHTSHPQHPLKLLTYEAIPDYADKKCLLCGIEFHRRLHHHCDVCNFSICRECMRNPPPLGVVSPTTHEHQLHLIPRRIDFTCNACGTQGDRSPYFCLQCNFMIHRDCIDLPRVININRHDHRISYTRRLGHGNWKCGVCRKKVDGFHGGYSCSKCSTYVVHSRCAIRKDVWDMIEREGTPEEPEESPFMVIDDYTIKHFSHDHNLRINMDGRILHESTLCKACVFQICSEPFYSCEQCDFILHQKCANLPRKKRHVCHNQQFILDTSSECRSYVCRLCRQGSTGFRYKYYDIILDVRCGSISEPFAHKSHQHPLYCYKYTSKSCSACGEWYYGDGFSCDECDFSLDYKCSILPQKVIRHRYDDHPLLLSYGENSVDGQYWCEACETKLDPKKGFYTCTDCGVTLHISCVVGDFSYIMPGSQYWSNEEVIISNTSICRPLCIVCNNRSCSLVFAQARFSIETDLQALLEFKSQVSKNKRSLRIWNRRQTINTRRCIQIGSSTFKKKRQTTHLQAAITSTATQSRWGRVPRAKEVITPLMNG